MKSTLRSSAKKGIILSSIVLLAFAIACETEQKPESDGPLAQINLKPWEYSLDSNYALQFTDKYAWEVFRAINWPADTITMTPDTTRIFGDSGIVVWQTWKTDPEVYLPDGSAPKGWLDKNFGIKSLKDFPKTSLKDAVTNISADPTFGVEDVGFNKPAFDYIVSNQLYNLNGQLAIYNSDSTVKFPVDAIEVKVKWREIPNTPYEKARYHWQYLTVENNGKIETRLYGMAAMHMSTRIITKWIWATFEHIDNRSQLHPGDDGWLLTSKDKFACKQPPYDCEMAPRNFGLEGTKWEYYRLRGTQSNYLNEEGDTSLLANSNVERGFQMSSSCITCHSLATIGPIDTSHNMTRISFVRSLMMESGQMYGGRGYVGYPDSNLFNLQSGGKMKRSDFDWSLSNAVWRQDTAIKKK